MAIRLIVRAPFSLKLVLCIAIDLSHFGHTQFLGSFWKITVAIVEVEVDEGSLLLYLATRS